MCRKWQSGVLLGIMQECGYFSSNLFVPEEVVQEEKVSSIVGFDILQEEAAMGVGIDIIVHGKEYVFAGALGRASLVIAVALGRRSIGSRLLCGGSGLCRDMLAAAGAFVVWATVVCSF